MKTMILTASLMSMLFFAGSAFAVEEHHPEKKDAPVAAAEMKAEQVEMGQMDAQIKKMEEIRNKMEMEKDPAARRALMQEQMQMMQDCMKMMGGQGMMGGKGMPMDDRMGMMEKKMKMMQEMMNNMMMQQEMKME